MWNDRPKWHICLQQIAAKTPPLVPGPSVSGHGFLDRELAANPVHKCYMMPSKSITAVLKGASKTVTKDKHVLRALKALARFNLGSLSAGQVWCVLYLLCEEFIDSFRL